MRLYIGFIVFYLAEFFASSSPNGLLDPFSLILTYWLYFSHFFLFSTIAVYYNKTTLRELYFLGCIFGLYETFITRVVWFGYIGEDGYALGSVGGFGIHEFIGPILFWHPIMSFILPFIITNLLVSPKTGVLQFKIEKYTKNRKILVLLFVIPIGMISFNQGGPIGIILQLIFSGLILWLGYNHLFRQFNDKTDNDRSNSLTEIFVLSKKGFGICISYLFLLYLFGFFILTSNLPAPSISQLVFTIFWYLIFIILFIRTKRANDISYNLTQFHPYSLLKSYLSIVLSGLILSILTPLNFLFFVFSILSIIPLGIFLLYSAITYNYIFDTNQINQN